VLPEVKRAPGDLEAGSKALRPRVEGKFFFVGADKFHVRGLSYGAFRPAEDGSEYHDGARIEQDFALMAAHGFNTVRIPHTTPPRALLDSALRHGLRVMVGLSAESYVGFLIDGRPVSEIEERIRSRLRPIAGHPALLCYAIGNEIPAPLARWLGRDRLQRYLRRLHGLLRAEDPGGIATYVNYPTTEYLRLPFLDAVSFNVYLEDRAAFRAYLARLQNLAGDRPLLMSEMGLDSLRNGEEGQARALDWQIREAFAAGCAGAIVFSWTDEWFRGGGDVDDWAFGLVDRERRPKPALDAVEKAFSEIPFAPNAPRPRISVVLCTYNGERTIRESLEHLTRLKYPDFEVIVVNDGSSDGTLEIVRDFDVKLISTEQGGLSRARNIGLQAATGEIVAYIDDDAYPDADWLDYLAQSFRTSDHVGVGGPNLPPRDDGRMADCVAHAPGGPVHVLLTDDRAEHIPGCNMAFRRSALLEIGGFDTRFRAAGDDVDVCWRLQERGGTLGFSPAAVVWHHRRDSLGGYWRQQVGYGRAEGLLEAKWPEKYNSAGHHTFSGRIYGAGATLPFTLPSRVYHGIWGMAPFQSVYARAPGLLGSFPLMPEWYLLIGFVAALGALGAFWEPFEASLPVAVALLLLSVIQAFRSAIGVPVSRLPARERWLRVLLTTGLHLLQPLARLRGRLAQGLSFWRHRAQPDFAFPRTRGTAKWTEEWIDPQERLRAVERELRAARCIVVSGHPFARWDLEVRGGLLGAVRLLMAVEDHGSGTQYIRARTTPWVRPVGMLWIGLFGALCLAAGLDAEWPVFGILGILTGVVGLRTIQQSGRATAAALRALRASGSE
jgi:GT2 family glycosyltransferase